MALKSLPLLLAVTATVEILVLGGAEPKQVTRKKRSEEVLVERLSQQVNTLTAQLTQQAKTVDTLHGKVLELDTRTKTLYDMVAFYAWSDSNPLHAESGTTLILDHAATNLGNAYNTTTGVFTAPVAGVYDFQASILCKLLPGAAWVNIVVDGRIVARGVSDNRHGYYDQATMKAIVHVDAGSKVYLRNHLRADFYGGTGSHFTTFSGFLIKEDW